MVIKYISPLKTMSKSDLNKNRSFTTISLLKLPKIWVRELESYGYSYPDIPTANSREELFFRRKEVAEYMRFMLMKRRIVFLSCKHLDEFPVKNKNLHIVRSLDWLELPVLARIRPKKGHWMVVLVPPYNPEKGKRFSPFYHTFLRLVIGKIRYCSYHHYFEYIGGEIAVNNDYIYSDDKLNRVIFTGREVTPPFCPENATYSIACDKYIRNQPVVERPNRWYRFKSRIPFMGSVVYCELGYDVSMYSEELTIINLLLKCMKYLLSFDSILWKEEGCAGEVSGIRYTTNWANTVIVTK